MFQQMEGRLGLKERDGRDKLLDLFCVEERRRGGGTKYPALAVGIFKIQTMLYF